MSQSIKSSDYLITDSAQFKTICQRAGEEDFVAIDTEFMRQNTYFADLCLVQIGFSDQAYCIDVFEIDDLSPLAELLVDESTLKVFHSCRQDFEVLFQRLGVVPKPLFDTQLAAAFCGYDAQAGYARVVKDELDIELDKSQTRTDWSRRPLSEAQISYAAEDVIYLGKVYEVLKNRLESLGRTSWFGEETETFYNIDDYDIKPENAYKRLNGSSLSPKAQQLLVLIAEWREAKAQKRNIPRTWVLKDKELYEIAVVCAASPNALASSEVGQLKNVKRHLKKIIAMSRELDEQSKASRVWTHYLPFDSEEKQQVKDLLKKLANLSKEIQIAQSLLATRKDVEAMFRGDKKSRVNQGWRAKQVAPYLQIQS